MYKLLIFICIIFFLSDQAFSQYQEESNYTGIGIPFFEYTLNRQFSKDFNKSTVKIFAQIVYDDITFIKSDTSGYDAELEWLVAVYSDDDQLIYSRTVSKSVNVKNYDTTNSRDGIVTINSEIELDPGEYKILLRTIDLTTNKTAQRRLNLEIPSYNDENIAVSEILFLKSVQFDSVGEIKAYEPILGNNFTVKEGKFYLYFNIYSKQTGSKATIHYRFINDKHITDFDSVTISDVKSHITPAILKIDKGIFKANKYNIEVNVEIGDNSADVSKKITFFWRAVPSTQTDIDEALRQMVYILPSDSLSYYLDASMEEKQEFFQRFWNARDPDPKTKKNELMDEYFKRINYANQNFSGLSSDGWLTDRGRILVKFGHPDDIERHPFEPDSQPYVIWRYYTLRKVFVFEDYSGFGDFRLSPGYLHVEYE